MDSEARSSPLTADQALGIFLNEHGQNSAWREAEEMSSRHHRDGLKDENPLDLKPGFDTYVTAQLLEGSSAGGSTPGRASDLSSNCPTCSTSVSTPGATLTTRGIGPCCPEVTCSVCELNGYLSSWAAHATTNDGTFRVIVFDDSPFEVEVVSMLCEGASFEGIFAAMVLVGSCIANDCLLQ
jgi:hypothetical protein